MNGRDETQSELTMLDDNLCWDMAVLQLCEIFFCVCIAAQLPPGYDGNSNSHVRAQL